MFVFPKRNTEIPVLCSLEQVKGKKLLNFNRSKILPYYMYKHGFRLALKHG